MDRRKDVEVRHIAADDPDRLPALHIALEAPMPTSGTRSAAQVVDLIDRAAQRAICIDLLYGAYLGRRLVGACVAAESAGRAALVFVPTRDGRHVNLAATGKALDALRLAAWERGIQLLEVLLAPLARSAGTMLSEAGFRYLTQLRYLRRTVQTEPPSECPTIDLDWTPYTPEAVPLFCAALDRSYVQSLDCPELTGLRATREVLAGHQSTGEFDPSLWWVASQAGEPVGILLQSRIAGLPALEIVYVGVAQPVRGTGVANALLHRALADARRFCATTITLAVDGRNTPALRMYRRWRFEDALARDAWIASPSLD